MADIDWSDPAARLALIERVGIEAYNRLLEEHFKSQTETAIAGHAIRRLPSRFGQLYAVGSTGKGFHTLQEAVDYAQQNTAAESGAQEGEDR